MSGLPHCATVSTEGLLDLWILLNRPDISYRLYNDDVGSDTAPKCKKNINIMVETMEKTKRYDEL